MPIRHWLDRAMCKYGGSYLDSEVSEVKTLGRISVMLVMFIPYWMIYYQVRKDLCPLSVNCMHEAVLQ